MFFFKRSLICPECSSMPFFFSFLMLIFLLIPVSFSSCLVEDSGHKCNERTALARSSWPDDPCSHGLVLGCKLMHAMNEKHQLMSFGWKYLDLDWRKPLILVSKNSLSSNPCQLSVWSLEARAACAEVKCTDAELYFFLFRELVSS